MQDVRWDRAVMRILVCVAVVVSTFPSALAADAALPGWRVGLGLAAAVLLCAATIVGLGHPRQRTGLPAWTTAVAALTASTLITATLPFDPNVWIAFMGAAVAGLSGFTLGGAMVLAVPPVAALAWRSWGSGVGPTATLVNIGASAAVFALAYSRQRQREARELAEAQRRVIELERTRLRAGAQQREVAAQLHDVLAHTLSGLIVTLQAATLAARLEHVSVDLRSRLETATALAKDGLIESRRAVESLQAAATGHTPALGPWLQQALDRLRAGGDLDVTVTGHPDAVPEEWADLTRSVLMEALTNTMRHAAGAPVRITFTGPPRPGVSVLSVGDPASFTDRRHPSGGHGLAGLRERVTLRGGTLDYGTAEAGFEIALGTTAR